MKTYITELLAALQIIWSGNATNWCQDIQRDLHRPLKLQMRHINGEELGGVATATVDGITVKYRIGPFIYQRGEGKEFRSNDTRFDGIRVTAIRGSHHECGYNFSIIPHHTHRQGSPKYLLRFEVSKSGDFATPGSIAAAESGSHPVMPGFRPGSSWPVTSGTTSYFIGLMHPTNGQAGTLVVRFESLENSKTTRLGYLPLSFQKVSILPKLHENGYLLKLEGKGNEPGAPLRIVTLEFDGVLPASR